MSQNGSENAGKPQQSWKQFCIDITLNSLTMEYHILLWRAFVGRLFGATTIPPPPPPPNTPKPKTTKHAPEVADKASAVGWGKFFKIFNLWKSLFKLKNPFKFHVFYQKFLPKIFKICHPTPTHPAAATPAPPSRRHCRRPDVDAGGGWLLLAPEAFGAFLVGIPHGFCLFVIIVCLGFAF